MRLDCTDVNSRQILVSGVNPKLVHADMGQLGVEISLSGREKVPLNGTKSRLISKRVGKAEYPASRHFHTPGIVETENVLPGRALTKYETMSDARSADDRQELLTDRRRTAAERECRNIARRIVRREYYAAVMYVK
jgi:hypothetical protein